MNRRSLSLSRRTFLSAPAAGAAYVYAGARDMSAEAAEAPSDVGASKWDLDTPALCVDLDRLEANIAKMQATVKRNGIATRPHAKTHKCAAIAKLQMAAGAIGLCAAKLERGRGADERRHRQDLHDDGNPSVNKIRRAMQLRKKFPHFIQAVDEEKNARDLSEAAKEARVVADVVIDVAVGTRSGIPPGDDAVALAKLIDTLPGSEAARHAVVRRRRAAREHLCRAQGTRAQEHGSQRRTCSPR